jgi:hypothetical protein
MVHHKSISQIWWHDLFLVLVLTMSNEVMMDELITKQNVRSE